MLNRDNERDGWKINASAGISRVASRFVASGRISACVRSVAALAAALAILGALSVTPPAHAQCQGAGWLPGEGVPGVNSGPDRAVFVGTTWDPDGPGPRGPVLVVGGLFTQAGEHLVRSLAAFDPQTQRWSPVSAPGAAGVSGDVWGIVGLPNGDLVVAGGFSSIDGVPVRNIARWDGSQWTPVGGGTDRKIHSMIRLPNGDIVIGGEFTEAGGVSASRIARWDGTSWNPLGDGVRGFAVYALALLPNGDLLAGGPITSAGGAPASLIARWDGSAWFPLTTGQGLTGFEVNAIAVASDGRVFAGGAFRSGASQTSDNIAVWNGVSWSPLGTGTNRRVLALAFGPGGDLWVGGEFTSAGGVFGTNGVARWDGSQWLRAGGGFGSTTLVENVGWGFAQLPSGDFLAFGSFSSARMSAPSGTIALHRVARWTGDTWAPLGRELAGGIIDLVALRNGRILASSSEVALTSTIPATVNRWTLVEWNGSGWTRFAPRIYAPFPFLGASSTHVFSRQLTSTPATYVTRLTDSGWETLGEPFATPPAGVVERSNGTLVAWRRSGSPGPNQTEYVFSSWDGNNWSTAASGRVVFGYSGSEYDVRVVALRNGDLVVSGIFNSVNGTPARNIARWDGTSWSPMGEGLESAAGSFVVDNNGDLICAGFVSQPNSTEVRPYIARWTGTAWVDHSQPPGIVGGLIALPGGRLAGITRSAARISGQGSDQIVIWDGLEWKVLVTLAPNAGAFSGVRLLPNGELAAWGGIGQIGGVVSNSFARYSFTGIPAVGRQPKAAAFGAGDTVTLSATASPGYQNVSVQWKRSGAPIANGPEGASAGGGTVSGAADTLASPTDGTPSTLTITNIQPSDVGDYTATFTNACGSSETVVAKVRCRADFDGSMFVDANDYVLFIDHFVRGCTGAGQSNSGPDASCVTSADVDGSGFIDVDDFVAFVNAFERGC